MGTNCEHLDEAKVQVCISPHLEKNRQCLWLNESSCILNFQFY